MVYEEAVRNLCHLKLFIVQWLTLRELLLLKFSHYSTVFYFFFVFECFIFTLSFIFPALPLYTKLLDNI